MFPGPLDINESFPFRCATCGECCSGTMMVFLNPEDVIQLAVHLGYEQTLELWENGYLITESGQNGTLLPRLKFAGLSPGFCPFVVNDWNEETSCLRGTCSIHGTAKPLICRLAPIAREVDFEEEEEEYFFKAPVIGCPGCNENEEIRLSDYLKKLKPELDREKRWFELMNKALDRKANPELLLKTFFHLELPVDFDALLSEWEKDPRFSC